MRTCDNQEVLAVRKLRAKKGNGKICSHEGNSGGRAKDVVEGGLHLRCLPHRILILLIDRVGDFEVDVECSAEKGSALRHDWRRRSSALSTAAFDTMRVQPFDRALSDGEISRKNVCWR